MQFLSQPPTLTRTSSASSIASDISTELDITADGLDAASRRTRKRFSNVQLMMLEQLYHQTSHPTREQRDAIAKQTDMETRSVTVWFQNKRQTDRRVALTNAANVRTTLSSPFSSTSASTTIHTRSRTRILSASQSSPHAAGPSRDRTLRRTLVMRHPSLDHIAARSERPNRTPPATPPRRTIPRADARTPPRPPALWESMASSSPAGDDAPNPAAERAFVDFGRTRVRRMRTLEWACAAARVGGRAGPEQEPDEDALVLDLGGDTEDEGEHEAVTPKSSLGRRSGGRSIATVAESKESRALGAMGRAQPVGVHDEEDMNAALALCGLGVGR